MRYYVMGYLSGIFVNTLRYFLTYHLFSATDSMATCIKSPEGNVGVTTLDS